MLLNYWTILFSFLYTVAFVQSYLLKRLLTYLLTYLLDDDSKGLAYCSLVRPVLEYAAAAWDPYTQKDINRIEMVQRRAARFVKHDYRRSTSVTSIVDELGWSTLSNRRRASRLALFYKSYNGLSPISLSHLERPSCTRMTSDGLCFIAVSTRIDAYKFSFFSENCEWMECSAIRNSF